MKIAKLIANNESAVLAAFAALGGLVIAAAKQIEESKEQ